MPASLAWIVIGGALWLLMRVLRVDERRSQAWAVAVGLACGAVLIVVVSFFAGWSS